MKVVLNVAEKPSVAKEIVKYLAKGSASTKFYASKYNPVYEFHYNLRNEKVLMRVASVTGHIMGLEFVEPYNKWNYVSPDQLFEAPIRKSVNEDKLDVVKTLQTASKGANLLALWLDCDREGENIAYEVVKIVEEIEKIEIRRAHFSALTESDIRSAIENLGYPKKELSEAVDARQEIDLRLGAIFTRLQTMSLKNEVGMLTNSVISWGPCQFPTLGFVVSRYLEIQNFIKEKYWTIDLTINKEGKSAKFNWKREKLFDFLVTLVLYENCLSKQAVISSVSKNPKNKRKPIPLATVEFIKLASSKLKLSSEKAMDIAEKLYQRGIISYPRTETDSFKDTINLRQLIEIHKNHPVWGTYAESLEQGGYSSPRGGSHDDNSHPPIHPVKSITQENLSAEEWKVYELITRRFLACCSMDAKGFETKVELKLGDEAFESKGTMISEYNFLEIYTYMNWNEAELPNFNEGEEIQPSSFLMNEHTTQPPSLLSESDLISVMDKSGIGTDATIPQHIKTIQERKYAEKIQNGLFKPTILGLALVEGYSHLGVGLHQPELRAKMEREMNGIVNGNKDRESVIKLILDEMKEVYLNVKRSFHVVAGKVKERVSEVENNRAVVCTKCGGEGHTANNCRQESREMEVKIQVCFKCGQEGHYANMCTERKNLQKKVVCYKCGAEGHYANKCDGNKVKAADENNPSGKAEGKVCPKCGHKGRHPKGSECLKRSKK